MLLAGGQKGYIFKYIEYRIYLKLKKNIQQAKDKRSSCLTSNKIDIRAKVIIIDRDSYNRRVKSLVI